MKIYTRRESNDFVEQITKIAQDAVQNGVEIDGYTFAFCYECQSGEIVLMSSEEEFDNFFLRETAEDTMYEKEMDWTYGFIIARECAF